MPSARRPVLICFHVPAEASGGLGLTMQCSERGVRRVIFGPSTPDTSRQALAEFDARYGWRLALLSAIYAYFSGHPVDFRAIPVDLSGQPPFRRKVQERCRRIPFGHTLSYAALADAVGSPRASRAVGAAMSHNPLPLLIPCHRVVRSDGGLGGYNAPGGVAVKERLLIWERDVRAANSALPAPGRPVSYRSPRGRRLAAGI